MNGPINGRSLAEILSEMKDELQDFVQTRVELLKREVQERLAALKSAVPLVLVAALLLATAFLLLSLALVGVFAGIFAGNPYNWFFAFLIVGFFWAVIGAFIGAAAMKRLTRQPMVPQKTIEVLSGDKAWLQHEAREAKTAL